MKLLPILFLCLLCAGCSTYQYVTLSSPLKNERQQLFVVENDTVKISYDFSGEQGPVKITVYNKLSTPLYIDWNKSALIIGNTRISYLDKDLSLHAELNGTETRWLNSTSESATIKGRLTGSAISGFIPPKSQAEEVPLKLKPKAFHLPAAASEKVRKMEEGIIVEFITYSRDESPLTFRSYLTISTHADLSSPVHFDHEFWASEVFQTLNGPNKFSAKPNRFYLKKTASGGE